MKLLFKRNRSLEEYHGNGVHFLHGEEQEVPDKEAQGLLKDFPENFSKALDKPVADRQIKGAAKKDQAK